MPVPEHNSLVSSAIRMPPVSALATGKNQHWQGQAWDYYDKIGELRFVSNWVGNVMSRARLVAAQDIDGVLVVQTGGPAAAVMEAYYGGLQGQAQMLQRVGVHLTVAGECWQVATKDEEWHTLSYNKVSGSGGQLRADLGDGKRYSLGASDVVMRVWTPHPEQPLYADSPVRSNLTTLAELAALNAHVRAQLISRLAGAGILLLPSEIQFPVKDSADPAASQADAFMAVLAEAMMTPIQEPDSASAVVPIVVTAPGESIGDVKHITFWSELDDKVVEMRENAVKRLALGLDTPPEVLLGMSDANHWNAWLVDEAAVKSHLEPRLAVVCHAATATWLRPALEGQVTNPEDFYVLADTSDIRLRPNRSKEALELWDRGELSGEAVRRETGFKPEDAPGQDEAKLWMLRKIATGSTSPEQTVAALRILGVDLPALPGETENAQITPVLDNRRSLEDHPQNKVPDIDRSRQDREQPARNGEALAAACEVLVYRALERAGNKLCDAKAKANGLGEHPPHTRHLYMSGNPDSLMEGTWSFAGEVLGAYNIPPANVATVISLLDAYTRGLLARQEPYSRDAMRALLASGLR